MVKKGYRILAVLLGTTYILLGVKSDNIKYQLKELETEISELKIKEAYLKKERDSLEKTLEIMETEKKELKIENEKLKEKPNRGGNTSQRAKIESIPEHSTFKSYMDYRAITRIGSPQYELQQQAVSINGFRMLDGRYMIALGSAFGKVGDYVTISLTNGTSIPCIIGDIKADRHTDNSNKVHLSDGSLVEFIVDTRSLSGKIKSMGDCSYAEHVNLQGRVQDILR